MSDTKIHLMALAPKSNVETEVHTVGLPPSLQEALFELKPPKNPQGCLSTRELKEEVRRWIGQAVELNPVRPGLRQKSWLVALEPVDLERLCNVIASWLFHSCDAETRASPVFKETIASLQPSLFSNYVGAQRLRLFDENGRPTEEAGGLSFSAFSAQVANALVGKPLYLDSGVCLTFNRLPGGTGSDYHLMSNVLMHKECPYAIVLRFHVETLPVNRRARLCVSATVRRFIHKKWTDNPYPYMGKKSVHACVRTDNGTFRAIPYRYDKLTGHPEWEEMPKSNYEGAGFAKLPSMEEYFSNMGAFAQEGHSPQILSPYSTSSAWAANTKVATGVSMVDKADLFSAVAQELSGFATELEPLSSANLGSLKTTFTEPEASMWEEHPEEARAQHALWVRSNRQRLAACTGERRIRFELMGTAADDAILDLVEQQITYFLGEAGDIDNVVVIIERLHQDELLAPLEKEGDAYARVRMREIERVLGEARGLTARIVALPNAEAFERAEKGDPKTAIRMGLAKTGRLSQFIVPEMNESAEHRACAAVRDLMRQLGFIPEPRPVRNIHGYDIPTVGLRLYSSPNGKKFAQFPLAVRIEPVKGAVTVDCPLFKDGRLPYWKAELELARLTTSAEFSSASQDGLQLKRMVDRMKAEASRETLLLVQAYGAIRRDKWWPGLTDRSLGDGPLRYGPSAVWSGSQLTSAEEPFELGNSKLSILRVRSGADGEVPDYYTDLKPENEGDRSCYCKQGLFPADGYVLGLTVKPGADDYKWSMKNSKFDDPSKRYAEKTLNEYCLLASHDPSKLLEYAKYAEALRGTMVQLVKSDMRVNLPGPLHLATCLDEYIWAAEKPRNKNRSK